MHVTLPDATELQLDDGATGADAAAAIGAGLARAALAVKVDGRVRDLAAPLPDSAGLEVVTARSPEALELIRHDAAHVLATAVLELYPGVRISIGPPIQDGFYYDFEFPPGVTISEADFPRIEAKMAEHIKAAEPFVREDVPVGQALERFVRADQPYKVELIEDLIRNEGVETVSLYTNGPFTDLCRGPHAPTTKTIKAYKLQSVAGAYWRGDANRTMLTRVYGTAFLSKEDLETHLERLEQARARDHRKLGRELGLFEFSEVSPGMAFWLPRGTFLWNELVALTRHMNAERGYTEVKTPQLYDSQLWKTSGHWDKYRENMFITEAEDRQMALKPMNCPGHCHLYSMHPHSYRDLPIRFSEPGLLHRYEPSGTLHGLLRVRHFVQDDAHIFCRDDQIFDEVIGCIEQAFATYAIFGFDVKLELSTRPDERVGSDELWDRAEGILRDALESRELGFDVNEGDGAFYGPKIDFHLTDSLGRSWQLGTVQMDFNFPERFGLEYQGADNAAHRPAMIHRAILGSFERFIGLLIEHYAGEFPVWLAPVQGIVLPISDRHAEAAAATRDALHALGVRAEVDDRSESIGRRIRDAELQKIPYMLVVGDREIEEGSVAVRRHGEGDLGSELIEAFARRVTDERPIGYTGQR
ncbi:threonine--tRNA ligase [Capillimicrobium parvum]|uniref:Threonine--tRNA ligase n=1 Tax=Capillimicrobium parvum TaxID=2884022 RepID=A0A9E7C146_9ACTN|nr:threonine--tRNA ligase [Capillimicrobium parvum]UGS36207.1 Threonine--tRNA ligase 2 [Capillimicrobium parvum]